MSTTITETIAPVSDENFTEFNPPSIVDVEIAPTTNINKSNITNDIVELNTSNFKSMRSKTINIPTIKRISLNHRVNKIVESHNKIKSTDGKTRTIKALHQQTIDRKKKHSTTKNISGNVTVFEVDGKSASKTIHTTNINANQNNIVTKHKDETATDNEKNDSHELVPVEPDYNAPLIPRIDIFDPSPDYSQLSYGQMRDYLSAYSNEFNAIQMRKGKNETAVVIEWKLHDAELLSYLRILHSRLRGMQEDTIVSERSVRNKNALAAAIIATEFAGKKIFGKMFKGFAVSQLNDLAIYDSAIYEYSRRSGPSMVEGLGPFTQICFTMISSSVLFVIGTFLKEQIGDEFGGKIADCIKKYFNGEAAEVSIGGFGKMIDQGMFGGLLSGIVAPATSAMSDKLTPIVGTNEKKLEKPKRRSID